MPNALYLMSQTCYEGAYILLFPVNLYMDYFASELLAMAWWSYVRIIITISHVFISASAFLIVAAAFERYITISKIRNQFARHHRLAICFMALVFAMIAKLPMYFEVEVVPNGNCTGLTSLTIIVSEFSETEPYKSAYKDCVVVTYFILKSSPKEQPELSESSPKNKRTRATTVRYCETGCGFMIYEKPTKTGEVRGRSIGTGLDRIVLSVAMGSLNTSHACKELRVRDRKWKAERKERSRKNDL
ncbi:hypothetical protein TELCIR_15218 [Teladorsagia circumcincta]|uniref:G-protein coupled receptors family 1 profile domain-containing protein n=1 Tax=Teladorsagia circumcincta TaxID=45464 RepID=A0A2G9TZ03_TELCI|nr:hypothetical protein TELCIR_15218 [Teladorsagia circumcincta]